MTQNYVSKNAINITQVPKEPRRTNVPFYLLKDHPEKKMLPIKLDIHKRITDELVPESSFFNSIVRKSIGGPKSAVPSRRITGNLRLLEKQKQIYLANFTEGRIVFDRNLDSNIRTRTASLTCRPSLGESIP